MAAFWRVPADWAVSWATTAPTHWTVSPVPAVPLAAGSAATTALVRAAQEKDPAWKDGCHLLPRRLATRPFWPCWMPGRMRSHRPAAWCTSSTRSSFSSAAAWSAQQKLLIEPIAAKVRASVMPAFAEGLEIRAAQLHNDVGMVGAVYYFRQQHGET